MNFPSEEEKLSILDGKKEGLGPNPESRGKEDQ